MSNAFIIYILTLEILHICNKLYEPPCSKYGLNCYHSDMTQENKNSVNKVESGFLDSMVSFASGAAQ